MVVDKIVENRKDYQSDDNVIPVFFEWFELEKKRISKKAEDGTEIGIQVENELKDGDVLGIQGDKVYVVQVLPAKLIKIHVDTMQQMGRLGFELGNRHLSLHIEEHEVVVPYDQPTFEYLVKLGFDAEEVTEQFTGFIHCKAHGHTHSHVHEK